MTSKINYSICVVSETVQNERDIKKETLPYRTRGVILQMIQNLQLFLIMPFYSLVSVPRTVYGIKTAYEVYFPVPDEIINNRNICNYINSQLDATRIHFIDKCNQLNMFRAIISPILRSTRLCLQLVMKCTSGAACWWLGSLSPAGSTAGA